MIRVFYAIILSSILVGLSLISDGFGDINSTFQTWVCSFTLPIWSLLTVSLWHDVGRFIWTNTFEVDSEESKVSYDIRSLVFIIWMSVVVTYIVWVHISLVAIPMLLVIPVIGYFLQDYLAHDWSIPPTFASKDLVPILCWAVASYYVYWFLTIAWIILRVWLLDNFEDGIVYFIQ